MFRLSTFFSLITKLQLQNWTAFSDSSNEWQNLWWRLKKASQSQEMLVRVEVKKRQINFYLTVTNTPFNHSILMGAFRFKVSASLPSQRLKKQNPQRLQIRRDIVLLYQPNQTNLTSGAKGCGRVVPSPHGGKGRAPPWPLNCSLSTSSGLTAGSTW